MKAFLEDEVIELIELLELRGRPLRRASPKSSTWRPAAASRSATYLAGPRARWPRPRRRPIGWRWRWGSPTPHMEVLS